MADHFNIPDVARPRRQRRRRRRRRGQENNRAGPVAYRVSVLAGGYLAALFVTVVGFLALNILFVPFYFLIGVLLTKFVSRRVIWNPYIASLGDIASAKVHTWLAWPVSIPVLIWQIFVVHHL